MVPPLVLCGTMPLLCGTISTMQYYISTTSVQCGTIGTMQDHWKYAVLLVLCDTIGTMRYPYHLHYAVPIPSILCSTTMDIMWYHCWYNVVPCRYYAVPIATMQYPLVLCGFHWYNVVPIVIIQYRRYYVVPSVQCDTISTMRYCWYYAVPSALCDTIGSMWYC